MVNFCWWFTAANFSVIAWNVKKITTKVYFLVVLINSALFQALIVTTFGTITTIGKMFRCLDQLAVTQLKIAIIANVLKDATDEKQSRNLSCVLQYFFI